MGAFTELTKEPSKPSSGRRRRESVPADAMDTDGDETVPLSAPASQLTMSESRDPNRAFVWALERIRELRSSLVGAYWDLLCVSSP